MTRSAPLRYDRVRVYWMIRTAHLERAREMTPASIVYRSERYDFAPELTAGVDAHPASLRRMVALLLRTPVARLEINEPLMLAGQLRTAIAVLVVRVAGALRRRRALVVSYAIENRDPWLEPRPTTAKGRLRHVVSLLVSRYVAGQVDRIAFGTSASADLYEQVLGRRLRRARRATVPALPAPCTCPAASADGEREPAGVVFVGTFDDRKGLPQLLDAWDAVRAQRPDARLTLIGRGRYEDRARATAAPEIGVDLAIDPPREDIHAALAHARVLVLASQPAANWREQVGLPIVEGLAHGLVVVTTDQTGLAEWLGAHGHVVLRDGEALADGVLRALASPHTPASVLADLPERDGRIVADDMLMS